MSWGWLLCYAVHPTALFVLLRRDLETELLLECAGDRTAHGVRLPGERLRYLIDGSPLGPAQHGDQLRLLAAVAGTGRSGARRA